MPSPEAQGFLRDFLSNAVWGTFYFWLPIILVYFFWKIWVYYVRANFIANINWVLLEIKVPRDISKSPKAIEVFLNAIHLTKDGNLVERFWQGFTRTWHSLEIVSLGGQVHFYIYTPRIVKNIITAQLYAQYPDVEVVEVEDYTKAVVIGGRLHPDYDTDGMEFVLAKPDPYPLKTYIDYGLHELATEEEQKTDPITSIIELLGSISPDEQLWLQILIRATKKDGWQKEAQDLVDKLMKREEAKSKEISFGALLLSPGERLVVEAIEREVSKLGYDVGIRFVYLAKKEKYSGITIASMVGVMKQFNALNLNGFTVRNRAAVEYFTKYREPRRFRKLINSYCLRSYFHPPYKRKIYVLNTEELATIYHFPGRVSETPTFGRIEAKKSEPPVNLPM